MFSYQDRNVCLLILDGWGINENPSLSLGDSIKKASTPSMDFLESTFSSLPLNAHGLAVGLPDGQMGNSEVGHMGIGAGRVLYQDIVRIDNCIKDNTLKDIESLRTFLSNSKGGKCHFIGLLSDGGVHSHQNHLEALLKTAKDIGVQDSIVHAILDGRDCPPKSGIKYINRLLDTFKSINHGTLGSVVGRYWAMDRDNRWDRLDKAMDLFINCKGELTRQEEISSFLLEKYSKTSDEFMDPISLSTSGHNTTNISAGDSVLFFNFRSDRMRQMVEMFSSVHHNPSSNISVKIPLNLSLITMTSYKDDWEIPTIFPKISITNTLSFLISQAGMKQFHCAETEKFAHVTFFFNGGIDEAMLGEHRSLIPSPKVSTYDLEPGMSVGKVGEEIEKAIIDDDGEKYRFIVGNFAPPDMVGHTGNLEKAIEAIEKTDVAIGSIWKAIEKRNDWVFIVTADHGNAEKMISDSGDPHTAHTCSRVPFIVADPKGLIKIIKEEENGAAVIHSLCDIAPSILRILGIAIPPQMSSSRELISFDL